MACQAVEQVEGGPRVKASGRAALEGGGAVDGAVELEQEGSDVGGHAPEDDRPCGIDPELKGGPVAPQPAQRGLDRCSTDPASAQHATAALWTAFAVHRAAVLS